ncbi:hypothetical protein [Streptomyces sp. LN590]|uniref:hypothetical protein n=1 Tax=Streptomyces sp. LN590 TaxID=3112980 RepID=UPI0037213B8C
MNVDPSEAARAVAATLFKPLAGEPSPFGPYVRHPGGLSGNTAANLSGYPNEAALSARVLQRLKPFFSIEEEVMGAHCSGKQLRIDAIVRPRIPGKWKSPDIALGLEFKRFTPGDVNISLHDVTGLAAQAIDYTHVEWKGYGRIPVFTCPGVLQWVGAGRTNGHLDQGAHLYGNLLGQLGVGELVLRWNYGLTFVMHDTSVWSERRGVERGKNWNLKPRAGSR